MAKVAQDTMLLHDLAEANKNTAAAAAVDNSLNTVKTTGDQTLTPTQGAVPPSPTPVTRVVPRASPSTNGGLVSARVTSDTSIVRIGARQAARTRPRAASSSDPCDSPDPVNQRSCLNRLIVENDADLNQTYQELIAQSRKSGGPGLEERLRQSQREWINTRDVQCQGVGDGALWARDRGRCLADHSRRRTAELQRSLNSLRGQ
ncbi:MAG: lysozyme inhibitor LprI family protein [Gemmatimonadaceae bacterium]